jgi:ABC-type uncharacterized transport system YnjBCD substrate-binding protein
LLYRITGHAAGLPEKEGVVKGIRYAVGILLFGLAATAAQAGPLDMAKAKAHLAAVASGDLDALMRDYDDNAYFDWVGGPLEGRYQGKAAIRAMWQKFIALNDGKPRTPTFGEVESYTHPAGTSVEAKAIYAGKTVSKVWHVLVYRDGTLTTEIWQNASELKLTP